VILDVESRPSVLPQGPVSYQDSPCGADVSRHLKALPMCRCGAITPIEQLESVPTFSIREGGEIRDLFNFSLWRSRWRKEPRLLLLRHLCGARARAVALSLSAFTNHLTAHA
jgi:hypothetical protein